MSYSIPSSTKILTLTTAPFLLVSVGALSACELAMVPQECIFYCVPRKKRYTLLPEGIDISIHIQQHNHKKDLTPCLSLYYYGNVIGKLENANKEFNCVYGVCNLTK